MFAVGAVRGTGGVPKSHDINDASSDAGLLEDLALHGNVDLLVALDVAAGRLPEGAVRHPALDEQDAVPSEDDCAGPIE
jgi:hypothetical protein